MMSQALPVHKGLHFPSATTYVEVLVPCTGQTPEYGGVMKIFSQIPECSLPYVEMPFKYVKLSTGSCSGVENV
jgi:hypothetical protein